MKLIRFKGKTGPYNPGEVAGFEDAEADRMIAIGIAEPAEAGVSKTEADKPKKSRSKSKSKGVAE